MSSRLLGEVGAEGAVDLAGGVALEAADDLRLGPAFGEASLHVGAGAFAVAEPTDDDHVQRTVGLTVSTAVEAMSDGLA